MEYDFSVEWQNIEYALNESEYITLSEISTGPMTGNLGRNMKMAGTAAYVGLGAPLMAVGAGSKVVGAAAGGLARGTINAAKGIARSRFGRMEFWGNLVQKLKEIWQKFKNIIAALFKTNESFINSELYNAEAVLRNALSDKRMSGRDFKIDDIYPYWKNAGLLLRIKVPQLNISDRRMMERLDDKNNFVNYHIRDLSSLDFNNGNCVEQLKQILRGSEQPMSIGIDDIAGNARYMVEFIQKSKQLLSELENEQNFIIRSAEEASRMVSQNANGNDNNSFANSYDAARNEQLTKDAIRIRNYISLAQNILGVKETIVHEYTSQSLNLLRVALRKCKSVVSGEIENTRMRHYIDEEDLKDEPTKQYGGKTLLGRGINHMNAKNDAARQLNSTAEKQFSIDSSYYDTLPNNKKELVREAEKAAQQRDRLKNFLQNKSMRADDPRFIEIKRVIDDYNRRIAVLKKKADSLPE